MTHYHKPQGKLGSGTTSPASDSLRACRSSFQSTGPICTNPGSEALRRESLQGKVDEQPPTRPSQQVTPLYQWTA